MGGVALHPAVQRLSEKEDPTIEERAIVGLMRSHLEQSNEHFQLLTRWLQEVNPLGLKGPALREWAEIVAEWILPLQMRRHNPNAATQGIITEGNQAEHQGGTSSREAAETGSSDSTQQGWQNPFA